MQIPGFEIIKSIGVGATSEVFKARNTTTDKLVALKSFSSVVTRDPECLARLRQEVEILQKLSHPNVVSLISDQSVDDRYLIELELVEGSDLKKWRANYSYRLNDPLLWILCQVLKGLGAAHEQHIIHRDLKPENILISNDGHVKITDFGLARSLDRLTMTKMGLIVGSLGYMAPEIINGERASTASDIFSFGAIAYELLTGKSAFHGETPQAMIKKIVDQEFVPLKTVAPHIPQTIARLIERCLNKNPQARPPSVWSVEAEIMNHLLASGIIPLCRPLVSVNSKEVLTKALQAKHQSLKNLKGKLAENSSQNKERIMDLVNELRFTYPDDNSAALLLADMARPVQPFFWKSHYGIAALVLLLLIPFGVYGLRQRQAPIETVSKVEVTPAQIAPAPAPAPAKPIPVPPVVVKGALEFQVDDGVKVFVNDREVPQARLSNYSIRPGTHLVKMLKEGFDPIESSVKVSANKTTTIRAKGALQ